MAGLPKELIENPSHSNVGKAADDDVLSDVLRTVRLSGSLQFCFMPSGAWQTEGKAGLKSLAENPSTAMPFHILVEGTCWLRMEGQESVLAAGDVVAFPFATAHQLGAGSGGRPVTPVETCHQNRGGKSRFSVMGRSSAGYGCSAGICSATR